MQNFVENRRSTLIDPDALREAIRLIEEYLFQGGAGFHEGKLRNARDMLIELSDMGGEAGE